MIAAGKKNKLKMKNKRKLCPLRLATRAGQNAMATQSNRAKNHQSQNPDIASIPNRLVNCGRERAVSSGI